MCAAIAVAVLGVFTSVAGAVVSSGHSGWSWANPTPQGEDVADLSFAGGTGYAVGGFGTLLRSTDGGQTWAGLPSRTTQGLTRVTPAGESGFVAGGGCAVRRSVDFGATLASINVGGGDQGCGTNVRAVAFADAANGLLVFENGLVLATADGGASLSRRTPVPGQPTDLVATSRTTAFATSGDAIYRTTDGGSSWTLVGLSPRTPPPLLPRTLRAIAFASATVGYAVGDGGTVLKTSDGGATWPAIAGPGAGVDLTRVRCATESLCLFTTAAGLSIVRTADGGTSYSQVTASGSPIRAVAFASPTRAVAAGAGGVTVLSDDGGATWRGVGGSIGGDLRSVVARPGGFGYAVGQATIAATIDGGETWRAFGIPTPQTIQVATLADPQTGYAQDSGRTLWRTRDGGSTWQVLDPGPATGILQDIVPLSRGRVLLVTATSIGRSADGGDTFALVDDATLRRSRAIRSGVIRSVGGGSRAFVLGARGSLRSSDGGRRWTRVPLPRVGRRATTIAAGDCAVPATCWVLTSGSRRLYRTSNFGRRWVDVTASVGVPLGNVQRIAAGQPGEAFLALRASGSALEQGLVLHTADGGRTWAPQFVGTQAIASIDAVPGRAWALSGLTRVFTTTSGGAAGTPSALSIRASARRIRRAATVTVTGRLPGAAGGEQVTLYASGFRPRTLTVASTGSFTSVFRLRKTTTFVAQWAGDGVRNGDGTPRLTVRRRRG
jgi:photosystem II stability/assembly factor-like uncharacterized protein